MSERHAAGEERLIEHFAGRVGVAEKKAFGRDALTLNGKVFAIFRLGELVVKLPAESGGELLDTGEATQFDPAHGRPMREWFVISSNAAPERWIELAEQSFGYVGSLQQS